MTHYSHAARSNAAGPQRARVTARSAVIGAPMSDTRNMHSGARQTLLAFAAFGLVLYLFS
jgi:hypothetical protein